MESWTAENFQIVGQALIQIAYNFWPVLFVAAGYVLWEMIYRPFERGARPKIKRANRQDRSRQYSRDAAQYTGRRHL